MLVYSGEWFFKYAELLEAKYAGKYAEFSEICGIYAAYNAYVRHIFFAYFRHMQTRVTKN